MPPQLLERIQELEQRPCPRVDLDPANEDAVVVIQTLIHENLRPLAPAAFDAATEDWDAAAQLRLVSRVSTALTNPDVLALLYPPPPAESR